MTKDLVYLLGDQLSPRISCLEGIDPATSVILITEVWDEATYVRHHKKKIALIFSAMRHMAAALRKDGWTVDYVQLDDAGNTGSTTSELARAVRRHEPSRIVVTRAAEYRVATLQDGWKRRLNVPVEIRPDTRFIWTTQRFAAWAEGRKVLRMENAYHELRRDTGYLMEPDGKPTGGQWNFDSENRKPAKDDLFMPRLPRFEPDKITRDVLSLVEARFPDHIGTLDGFGFAVTRADALIALDHFIQACLPRFGDYQDAMITGQKYLYHSVLSPYLNCGLLDPREICDAAQAAYDAGHAPLNAVEGFIRQIIGWREYVRGIYWLKMPGYEHSNFLDAKRPLPSFYWSGDTKMTCLREAIAQTIEESYAHHIQRLMITGNFAMLAGVDPHAVHVWYLEVYADAYEWVELPNTIGMSQFADGGLLGSKPYAGGGNYINKMSNYCKGCAYDVKARTGPKACPFNALYWHFIVRNRPKIGTNQRLRTVYASWVKMAPADRDKTLASAEAFLNALT